MSAAPGRPKQARTVAGGEGTPVNTPGRPQCAHRSAQHERAGVDFGDLLDHPASDGRTRSIHYRLDLQTVLRSGAK